MDDMDLLLVRELQGELPLTPDPYGDLAAKLGRPVDEVLLRLRAMGDEGTLKRIGAVLKHRNAGFTANGLFVCLVPEERIDEAGRSLAARGEVSHCYRRTPYPDWPYNLYAMIHGTSEEEVLRIAEAFVREEGASEHEILFSTEELKKTSFTL